MKLGGPGVICQIDESAFSHKPKYHRGRAPKSEIWVFGIVDTSFTPGRAYLQIVEDRSAATLLPIIRDVCKPGTIIHSDSWAAYSSIKRDLGFTHQQVNHSDVNHRFVAPDGTHTQAIESYWSKRKLRVKKMKGIRRNMLCEYLHEFMWRDFFGTDSFINLLRHISEQYPLL